MGNKGFTLLEIIIAMLILSIVTAGTYGLFVTNHRFIVGAKHRLQALNQAIAVAERLKMFVSECPVSPTIQGAELVNGTHLPSEIGFGDIPTIDGVTSQQWDYVVGDIGGVIEQNEEDLSAVDIDPPPIPDFKKVTVTVKWNEI